MATKKNRSTTKSLTPSKVKAAAQAQDRGASPTTTAVIASAPAARDRSGIVALLEQLRNYDAEVARDAAATLGRLPADREAVDALCDVVRNADGYFHPVVRAAAAAALGVLGDRNAVDALIVAMRDTMAEASEEAIKALGSLGDARAIPALEAAVRNEDGFFLEHVRTTARWSLEQIRRAAAGK